MATFVITNQTNNRPLRVIKAESHDNLRKAIIRLYENKRLYTGPMKTVAIYLATVPNEYDSLPCIAHMELGLYPGEYAWLGLVPRNLTVGWKEIDPRTGKLKRK